MNLERTGATLLLGGLLLGCRPAPLPGEPNAAANITVATGSSDGEEEILLMSVGDRDITLRELEYRADLASWGSRLRTETPEGRETFMTNLLRLELLSQVAEQEGLGSSPFVDLMRTDSLARARLIEEGRDGLTADDLTPEERTAVRPTLWERPELRRGRVAVYESEAAALAARETLNTALAMELTTPLRSFEAQLAERCAQSGPSAVCDRDGALGWIAATDPGVNLALRDALFAVDENGMLSEVYHTARGWEFILMTGVRASREWSEEELTNYYDEHALTLHAATVASAALATWREEAHVVRHADQMAQLAAARDDEPELTRPRRFERAALASGPEMILGFERAEELRDLDYNTLHTPLATPGPAPTPAHEPLDEADGEVSTP